MPVIKCKNCGGDIELSTDKTFGTCEYCGSTMTLPKVSNEQRAAAFNRGNHFRRIGEFDKALAVYERIVEEDDTDAEAHWCCALCRFGIEYVEDSSTYEWIPTCHRASFDSFLEDVDYLAALEYSDGITRRQYQKEAVKIADVQRGILATSQNEEPFDVFICYKELDSDGQRTKDSILAQDIYYNLTDQGWRVFFSRITLEDKAGTEYEPYIFAALNSAKVMICLGTKPEHFNAVWVKNEWSRFISIMKKDRSKLLLPCYRDMDPYDLPEQLSVLQAYDMGKIGFIQDLLRGVGKVLNAGKKQEPVKPNETAWTDSGNSTWQPLLKRGNMALEDGDFAKADELFEQVLNINPECAEAYGGKLLAGEQCRGFQQLKEKHLISSEPKETETLTACEAATSRIEDAVNKYYISQYLSVAEIKSRFDFPLEFESQVSSCKQEATTEKSFWDTNKLYNRALRFAHGGYAEKLIDLKQSIFGALDKRIKEAEEADEAKRSEICAAYADRIEEAIASVEKYHNYALKKKAEAEQRAKAVKANITKWSKIGCVAFVSILAVFILTTSLIIPAIKYSEAEKQLMSGDYAVAAVEFGKICSYRDAAELSKSAWAEIQKPNCISAYEHCTVGLKADGTVVAVGVNDDGQCDVEEWRNIVAVTAGSSHTVGLKSDGTVVAAGDKFYSVGYSYVEEFNMDNWQDIVSIAAGSKHIVGLKSDGTVVAIGDNFNGQCNVEDWQDVIAVAAGLYHTVGLKSDGTVVAVGDNHKGQCEVEEWRDIVAISAGNHHTVGLKSDGTVVAVGDNYSGQCNVEGWHDIKLPD